MNRVFLIRFVLLFSIFSAIFTSGFAQDTANVKLSLPVNAGGKVNLVKLAGSKEFVLKSTKSNQIDTNFKLAAYKLMVVGRKTNGPKFYNGKGPLIEPVRGILDSLLVGDLLTFSEIQVKGQDNIIRVIDNVGSVVGMDVSGNFDKNYGFGGSEIDSLMHKNIQEGQKMDPLALGLCSENLFDYLSTYHYSNLYDVDFYQLVLNGGYTKYVHNEKGLINYKFDLSVEEKLAEFVRIEDLSVPVLKPGIKPENAESTDYIDSMTKGQVYTSPQRLHLKQIIKPNTGKEEWFLLMTYAQRTIAVPVGSFIDNGIPFFGLISEYLNYVDYENSALYKEFLEFKMVEVFSTNWNNHLNFYQEVGEFQMHKIYYSIINRDPNEMKKNTLAAGQLSVITNRYSNSNHSQLSIIGKGITDYDFAKYRKFKNANWEYHKDLESLFRSGYKGLKMVDFIEGSVGFERDENQNNTQFLDLTNLQSITTHTVIGPKRDIYNFINLNLNIFISDESDNRILVGSYPGYFKLSDVLTVLSKQDILLLNLFN